MTTTGERKEVKPIAARRRYGNVYVHVLANGTIGLSPVVDGEKPPRPPQPEHTLAVSKDEWNDLARWADGLVNGPKPPPRPVIVPFQPAPWWLRLFGIGGVIPKAQVPKVYRGR